MHPSASDTLQEIEEALQALTLRVAELRSTQSPLDPPQPREPSIGDRVRFVINGNVTEGIIIGRTPQRVKIKVTGKRGYYLRAPHNVTIIQ